MNEDWKVKAAKWGHQSIQTLADLVDVAKSLKEKQSAFGKTTLVAKTVETIIERFSTSPDAYFKDSHNWEAINLDPLSRPVGKLLQGLSSTAVVAASATAVAKAYVATLDGGYRVGWNYYGPTNEFDCPVVPAKQDKAKTRLAIGRLLWRELGGRLRLAATNGKPELVPDILEDTLPSGTADALYARIKAFQDKGYRRAILLHGPPGTGKSHIIREVARQAGGRTLRVPAIAMTKDHGYGAVFKFMQPSAVLVDDFDRVQFSGGVLDQFEELRATTQLFLATVNNLEQLDPATLRAGRFDEVVEVKHLDAAVIARMTAGVPPEVLQALRGLPMAYIDEYRRAQDALGAVGPAELAGLVARAKRVEELSSLRGQHDDRRFDRNYSIAVPNSDDNIAKSADYGD